MAPAVLFSPYIPPFVHISLKLDYLCIDVYYIQHWPAIALAHVIYIYKRGAVCVIARAPFFLFFFFKFRHFLDGSR